MFHWIEVRAFCHATEEEDRVLVAIRTMVLEGEVRREVLAGHFGNPLVVLTVRVEGAAGKRAVWSRLVAALGRDEVLQGLEERLDEDAIYHLRISKQDAYLGRIVPAASSDVIAFRGKVEAFPKKRDVALDVLRRAAEAAPWT